MPGHAVKHWERVETKKNKTRKTGRHERERERDGGVEGRQRSWVWERGKKCHATAAVLGRFSKKKQDRKWGKRGNCGCNWSTRRATQTGEGVRYMLSLTHSSFPSPSFLISDRAAPWSPTRSMVNCSISDSATQRSRRWERMKRCTFPDLTFFWLFFFFFFFCQPYTLGPTGERQLAIIIAWCNTFRNWQAKEISSYCLELSHTHRLQLYHKEEWS